jgi:hypothetical protein
LDNALELYQEDFASLELETRDSLDSLLVDQIQKPSFAQPPQPQISVESQVSSLYESSSESPVHADLYADVYDINSKTLFPEFVERDILTLAEQELYIAQSIYESQYDHADAFESNIQAFVEESTSYPPSSRTLPAYTLSESASLQPLTPSQRASYSAKSRDLEAHLAQDGQTSQAAQELAAQDQLLSMIPDVPIQTRSERVIENIYAQWASRGSVDTEQVVDELLREARRVQWDHAVAQAEKGDSFSESRKRSPLVKHANVRASDSENKRESSRLLKEVLTSSSFTGTGIDGDAALDVLLSEAMRVIMSKQNEEKKKSISAKL